MTTEKTETEALSGARLLTKAASEASAGAVASASHLTEGGRLIDEHQVHAERIAQLATEARAAAELLAYAEAQAASGKPESLAEDQAPAVSADVVHKLRAAGEEDPEGF